MKYKNIYPIANILDCYRKTYFHALPISKIQSIERKLEKLIKSKTIPLQIRPISTSIKNSIISSEPP